MGEHTEHTKDEYWIALGMIEPEWVYMNHFLDQAEEIEEKIEVTEEIKPITNTQPTIVIRIRSRVE